MLSTFFDVVPQNAELNVVPGYEVGHAVFICSKFLTQEYPCAIHDKQATIFRSYDAIYRRNILL